jgi:WD40 repeat protein
MLDKYSLIALTPVPARSSGQTGGPAKQGLPQPRTSGRWEWLLWLAMLPAFASAAVAQNAPGVDPHLKSVSSAGSREIQLKSLEQATSPPVVTALAASPDGQYLAIAGDDHAIRILQVASGEEVQVVIGHSDWIRCLAFRELDDGRAPVLYSAGDDGLVLEWTFVQPLQSRELIRLPFAVRSLAVSADHQLLAMGGFSNDVLVWDSVNDLLLRRLRCPSGDIQAIAFSNDSRRVACGGRGGEISLWDAQTGEQIVVRGTHSRRVTALGFSRDDLLLTSIGEDRRLVRCDWASGRVQTDIELGRSKLKSLCMLGEYMIAVAGSDNRIVLYEVASNSVIEELDGHMGTVAVLARCGNNLVSGSFDTTVRIWDLESVERHPSSAGLPINTPVQMDSNWQIR